MVFDSAKKDLEGQLAPQQRVQARDPIDRFLGTDSEFVAAFGSEEKLDRRSLHRKNPSYLYTKVWKPKKTN